MSDTVSGFKYSVFERQDRKGWWYRYYMSENRRSPSFAVKTLVIKLGLQDEYPKVKNKKQAERIVLHAYSKGLIKLELGNRESLASYLLDYWDFNGKRIKRKNKMVNGRGRESVSDNYASIMQGYVRNHVVPNLKKGMAVGDVTPRFVRDFMNRLVDSGKLANATVDKIMIAFTKPLKDAWNDNMIHENPLKLLEHVDTSPERQRGILTRSEFQKVLALMKNNATEHVYLAVLLAAATGMRLGEIRALYASDIRVVNDQDAIVSINKSWSVRGGEKSTKGKKARYAPCPSWLAQKLLDLAGTNPRGSSMVFYSLGKTRMPNPVSSSYIRERFYDFLYDVLEEQAGIKVGTIVDDMAAFDRGITDKEGKPPKVRAGELIRRERNIDFHSFRHFFNTEAQALGADGNMLRLTVGHESKEMTNRYTHVEQRLDLIKPIADISHMIVEDAEVVE